MKPTIESLAERVSVLEARHNSISGSQDVILQILHDQGNRLREHSALLEHHSTLMEHHSAKLAEHDSRFDQIDRRLSDHDHRFDVIDGKLDIVLAWIETQRD